MQKLIDFIKNSFPAAYSNYLFVRVLVFGNNSFLDTLQWKRSVVEKRPFGKNGEVVPWMNYAMIAFLQKRLHNSLTLFEYGSGYSTNFYASKVAAVVSIENNLEWYKKVLPGLPENAKLHYFDSADADSYVNAIRTQDSRRFDIVVVDGRYRVRCIQAAVDKLSDTGVIILDDSEREKYKPGFTFLAKRGFKSITFLGVKPCSFHTAETTVFYRSENCLDI